MGLFNKKSIYQYNVLEQYKIDIDKFNNKAAVTDPKQNYCRLIGVTDKYNIYIFKSSDYGSGEYLLRQDKLSHKSVAYLGPAHNLYCVYHEKIFLMNYTSPKLNYLHPKLTCVDVETGKRSSFDILSSERVYLYLAGMVYDMSQDCIKSMTLQDDALVLAITRFPSGKHLELPAEKSFIYHIYIYLDGHNLKLTKKYPVGKAPKPKVSEDDIATKIVEKVISETAEMLRALEINKISCDPSKVFIATCGYCFIIWMICFKSLTVGRARKIEEAFRKRIIPYYVSAYGSSNLEVMNNDLSLKAYLWDVNIKIRTPYEEHGMVLDDYGISDGYISACIKETNNKDLVKSHVEKKIFEEWVNDAREVYESVYFA